MDQDTRRADMPSSAARYNTRRATFIAVANMKGGVGKTTTVIGLADFLASEKQASVLIVDLDQQASASLCVVGDAMLNQLIQQGRTIEAFLKRRILDGGDGKIETGVRRNTCNVLENQKPVFVSLLPASPYLRIVERDILLALTRRGMDYDAIIAFLQDVFAQAFARFLTDFDYVLFDCAPGISPLTEIAIKSCDLVVVPTIPDRISAFGLLAFMQNVVETSANNSVAGRTRVLFTRVQNGVSQHDAVRAMLRANGQLTVLHTEISQSATLAAGVFPDRAAGASSLQSFAQKYGQPAIGQFKALVAELHP